MRAFTPVAVALVAALLAAPAPAGVPADPAATGAEAWLQLVDGGAYGQSWQAAGYLFRANLPRDAWTLQIERLRRAYGAVTARGVASEVEQSTFPGGPDGDWKVMQFSTSFAKKPTSAETVVLLKERGGWRVETYGLN